MKSGSDGVSERRMMGGGAAAWKRLVSLQTRLLPPDRLTGPDGSAQTPWLCPDLRKWLAVRPEETLRKAEGCLSGFRISVPVLRHHLNGITVLPGASSPARLTRFCSAIFQPTHNSRYSPFSLDFLIPPCTSFSINKGNN
ncbi:hypothetical protein CCH79_00019027 [Gambusia affinis]|uniref:Uncharacterized protein n=1 Tax=Gambusia affinis TaxID=33528 RepID=A0A315VXY7_GAMAF|nr:hypothetical protein CCH79_00019027 [Gambusia affinis]